MPPSVTVVITTFNQAAYIGETIDSVLQQTYRDFEIVLVDDGSTDETPAVLAPYRGKVRCIHQANRGVAAARNVGVRQATGRLLAFLDGDDLWDPDKLEHQVRIADQCPTAGMIVADGVEFAPDRIIRTSLIGPSILPLLEKRESVTLRCYEELIRNNLISTTSQVMVPKVIMDAVGLSDPRFRVSSDWDLYLRIAAVSEVTFMRRKLLRYRYLPSSASGPLHLRRFRWGLDVVRILRKHVRLATSAARPVVRAELVRHTRVIAEEAYYRSLDGDRDWGRRYLFSLLMANPLSVAPSAYLLALCAPPGLTRRFGRVMRRVLGLHETS